MLVEPVSDANRVIELNAAAFRGFVHSHEVVVVQFWATWNGHDRKATLVVERASTIRQDVAFARFCVDPPEHHNICREHNLLNLPCVAVYRGGSLQLMGTGLAAIEALLSELERSPSSIQ